MHSSYILMDDINFLGCILSFGDCTTRKYFVNEVNVLVFTIIYLQHLNISILIELILCNRQCTQ